MKTPRQLELGEQPSVLKKRINHEKRNLECARIILADRAKYDTPEGKFVIVWAEAVVRKNRKA